MKLPLRKEGYFCVLDADGNQFAVVNVTASDGEATELRDKAVKAINAFPVLVEALEVVNDLTVNGHPTNEPWGLPDAVIEKVRNALKLAKGE